MEGRSQVTVWARPIPLIGDTTSAIERAGDPTGWAFSTSDQAALDAIIDARRDVRRFRPDDIDDDVVERLLHAAHRAPSVGHSQPWRFIVVRDPEIRT
ncbi:MAG: nitroreductase family protein, partial [Ilumatobacteraceae bacterium]